MSSTESATLVHPGAWTMARVNTKRLNGLRRRIAEAEAQSDALAAEIMALMAAHADPRMSERQLSDTLDTL